MASSWNGMIVSEDGWKTFTNGEGKLSEKTIHIHNKKESSVKIQWKDPNPSTL